MAFICQKVLFTVRSSFLTPALPGKEDRVGQRPTRGISDHEDEINSLRCFSHRYVLLEQYCDRTKT